MQRVRGLAAVLACTAIAVVAAHAETTFEYDALGRVISVSYANSTRIDYTYDANGNRTQVVTGVYPNNPPSAGLDAYTKAGASVSTLTVLDNDVDPESQALTISSVSTPTGGGAATRINGNTQISYTAGAVGSESFTYTIADGSGGSDTATVTVTVTNTAPVAVNDSYTQGAGAAATLSVLGNDSDANNHTLTIASVTAPSAGGTATRINGDTQISYTAPHTTGTDTFSYTISDGHGATANATVTMTIQAGTIAAISPSLGAVSGTNQTITMAQLAWLNGNTGTIYSFTPPANCGSKTIAGNGQSLTYTPPNFTFNICTSSSPSPRICAIPYVIRKTSTTTDTSGTATIAVEARPVSNPDPCD